jgi:hypothetical protein
VLWHRISDNNLNFRVNFTTESTREFICKRSLAEFAFKMVIAKACKGTPLRYKT